MTVLRPSGSRGTSPLTVLKSRPSFTLVAAVAVGFVVIMVVVVETAVAPPSEDTLFVSPLRSIFGLVGSAVRPIPTPL